jgi:hypothetical protein
MAIIIKSPGEIAAMRRNKVGSFSNKETQGYEIWLILWR